MENLIQLGITEIEAKILDIIIKHEKISGGTLIYLTGLHRNVVYDSLKRLMEKGLITRIKDENKTLFFTSKILLESYINKEELSLKLKKRLVNSLIKRNEESIKHKYGEVIPIIITGKKAVKFIYNKTLENKEYYILGGSKNSLYIMGELFWKNYEIKRTDKKIKLKIIFNEDLRSWAKYVLKNKYTKVRFIPQGFELNTETLIFNNLISIIFWLEKPLIIIIESKDLYESYKKYFELLWKESK